LAAPTDGPGPTETVQVALASSDSQSNGLRWVARLAACQRRGIRW